MYHRVKNNFQVISSLLSLKKEYFNDEKVVEAFRECQNHVISISLIHELLYQSGEDKLNFALYLQKLTSLQFSGYNTGSGNVKIELNVEETLLGPEIAIPLGIVVNELVSNSLKYAFPEGEGIIRIDFCTGKNYEGKSLKYVEDLNTGNIPLQNEHCILTVFDNGIRFPENIDFKNTSSMGMQIVNTLVDQINGSIELKIEEGTEFKMRFVYSGS